MAKKMSKETIITAFGSLERDGEIPQWNTVGTWINEYKGKAVDPGNLIEWQMEATYLADDW